MVWFRLLQSLALVSLMMALSGCGGAESEVAQTPSDGGLNNAQSTRNEVDQALNVPQKAVESSENEVDQALNVPQQTVESSANEVDQALNAPQQSVESSGRLVTESEPLPRSSYQLTPLSNTEFYGLSEVEQYRVADKLLSSLYFGLPPADLKAKIEGGSFIDDIWLGLHSSQNDMATIFNTLYTPHDSDDPNTLKFTDWHAPAEVDRILAMFYLMSALDRNYLNAWSAHVLSSTILFSPAYDLSSVHAPNIDNVFSRLYTGMNQKHTLANSVYQYMTSIDNWRRFRSPEDNGREMMEIFLMDGDDAKVPLAAKTLKNWRLDRDHDTLVVDYNENFEPVELFGTSVRTGYDFYEALVVQPEFVSAVAKRLTKVYFPENTAEYRAEIAASIANSNPTQWQDVLLQIVFSEAYLMNESMRVKSAEEAIFSSMKKLKFRAKQHFFENLGSNLMTMNQAVMKYKLGRSPSVPVDTLSFAGYHKYIREQIFLRDFDGERDDAATREGWVMQEVVPDQMFDGLSAYEHQAHAERLVDHLFLTFIQRLPSDEERLFFVDTFFDGHHYRYPFRVFRDDLSMWERSNAVRVVLDYLSRLGNVYTHGAK